MLGVLSQLVDGIALGGDGIRRPDVLRRAAPAGNHGGEEHDA